MKYQSMLLAALIVLPVSSMAYAAPGESETKPPAAPAKVAPPAKQTAPTKAVLYPLNGTVVAISKTELTIKGAEGKPDRIYVMTPETVIVNNDKPATIDDVKVGQKIGGRLEKSTNGHDKVVKINVGVKAKGSKTTKVK